jgi:hypothetical protein
MSLVKSREQKKAMKAIEIIFKGLDDDLLKQALLTAYAGEDPSILEAMKEQEQRDMEEILKQMELQRQEDVYEQNQNDLVEEKSNDIVDGNNTSNDSINQGHASATLE